MPSLYKAMASESSQATLPNTELGVKDISAFYEALCPVRAKYKFFGLQIGLALDEIETNYKDSEHCLLKVLSVRLKQEPALTCADIAKALRSRTVNECQLAKDFQRNFECQSNQQKGKIEESIMRKKVVKSKENLTMSKKGSERIKITEYVESESESDNDIHKADKYTEVERHVHERDEPKSKRAHKKEKTVKNKSSNEQPKPDEYKEYERKQTEGEQKQKMQFSKMAASPQSEAEPDQKRKKSVKESKESSPEIMSTDSENESSDTCKEKQLLLSKSEKTGKVRESAAYPEVKHQPQSKNEAIKKRKVPQKKEPSRIGHSILHRKIAVTVASDEDTSERPSHKSKKKLVAEETESDETKSTSGECESETESLEHRNMVTLKSSTHTEEIYHDSEEEIEKVRAKNKNKMPQKSKVATAKSSPHSERLVEEEQYKQNKGKRSVDMKKQERESEMRAKTSRGKVQKPNSQQNEREREKETDSGMKTKGPVNHSTDQTSDESKTDSENEESDSGTDSSEDGEVSEEKSSNKEEKTETDEESFTTPSEKEVKKKMREKREREREKAKKSGYEEVKEKKVSKAAVVPSKYDSLQGGRQFDETCSRKVKGKRESEAGSLKYYGSPGDDKKSDPGHGSRDQEECDIQQKRRNKKKKRREIPTAIGSFSPSGSQEEKKRPITKKLGHRKKHVRKMKERRERMKRGKERAGCSSDTDDSSPECDITKNQYKGEMKELVNIFEQFFGKLCCTVFDPKDVAAELQSVGLISKSMMREVMLSPESQQAKIITLVDELDKKIRSRPDRLFVIIKVMLKKETLQETAREILRQAGRKYFLSALHFVNQTLLPAGKVCPVETAAKFPSQAPPSDTAVSSAVEGR